MKKFNLKDIIIPTVSLFLICAVATALLGMTNSVTEEKIKEVAAASAAEARLRVCENAEKFEEKTDKNGNVYFEAKDKNGETVGFAITTEDKSYGGKIEVMTGFSADGKITGVEILTIDDTPGLGMNAKKESFRNEYLGKTGALTVSKSASADNEIQALTGATITSNAVTRCVNKAAEICENALGGENNG